MVVEHFLVTRSMSKFIEIGASVRFFNAYVDIHTLEQNNEPTNDLDDVLAVTPDHVDEMVTPAFENLNQSSQVSKAFQLTGRRSKNPQKKKSEQCDSQRFSFK